MTIYAEARAAVAQLAASAEPGGILTFAAIAEAADIDPGNRGRIRYLITVVRPILLRDYCRALVAVPGTGYRLAHPAEHAGLAERHRRRADTQVGRAVDLLDHTDLDALGPAERKAHEHTREIVVWLAAQQAGAARRLDRIERLLEQHGIT